MRLRIFTLVLALLCCCSGAWADFNKFDVSSWSSAGNVVTGYTYVQIGRAGSVQDITNGFQYTSDVVKANNGVYNASYGTLSPSFKELTSHEYQMSFTVNFNFTLHNQSNAVFELSTANKKTLFSLVADHARSNSTTGSTTYYYIVGGNNAFAARDASLTAKTNAEGAVGDGTRVTIGTDKLTNPNVTYKVSMSVDPEAGTGTLTIKDGSNKTLVDGKTISVDNAGLSYLYLTGMNYNGSVTTITVTDISVKAVGAPVVPTNDFTLKYYVNKSLVKSVSKSLANGNLSHADKMYSDGGASKYKFLRCDKSTDLNGNGIVNLYFEKMEPKNSYVEDINRGLVVVPMVNSNGTWVNREGLVSWRRLITDDENTTYDLLMNGNPIAENLRVTNYYCGVNSGRQFVVVTKVNGVEVSRTAPVQSDNWQGTTYKTLQMSRPDGVTTPDGVTCTYTPNDCSVGDVDGDGEYEIIVKWDPSNSQDNSKTGYTGNVYLDCYEFDGTQKWRIDLGKNIRAGAHYTQFLVYDFDHDGKAELICKTAPGSLDGIGEYVSSASSDANIVNTNNNADYRESSGYIISGPEYLTVFNGETGAAMHTIWYNPNRAREIGTNRESYYVSWDSSRESNTYPNRGERYLAAVAYLDGAEACPSAVMCRGYYSYAYVWAVDFDGNDLSTKWLHASTSNNQYTLYTDLSKSGETVYCNSNTSGSTNHYTAFANGNHNISVGDMDNDGFDEITMGACTIDHNGRLKYTTGYGHGDAIHLSDLMPDRPGLEVFTVHEEGSFGYDIHDAATGEILVNATATGDTGRGVAADIMPETSEGKYRGFEFWSSKDYTVRSVAEPTNDLFTEASNEGSNRQIFTNFRLYWTADLYDELLTGARITDYTGNNSTARIFSGDDGKHGAPHSCNGTKDTPCLTADLFGDWREEIVLYNYNDPSQLLIYSTSTPTPYLVTTPMQDHVYRMGIAWQNVGYNQPPHLGYYLPDVASVKVTFNGSGYAMFSSKKNVTVAGMNGVSAYRGGSISGDCINMYKVTEIPAGEGALLKGTANSTVYLPVIYAADEIAGNTLVGAPDGASVQANANYVLASAPTDELSVLASSTVAVGSAYVVKGGNSASTLKFVLREGLAGDVNGDGILTIADVVLANKCLLGEITSGTFVTRSDWNGDGKVTRDDVDNIANAVMNQE